MIATFQFMAIRLSAFLFLIAFGCFHHLIVCRFFDAAAGKPFVHQRLIFR
jgi:hypothetical protein